MATHADPLSHEALRDLYYSLASIDADALSGVDRGLFAGALELASRAEAAARTMAVPSAYLDATGWTSARSGWGSKDEDDADREALAFATLPAKAAPRRCGPWCMCGRCRADRDCRLAAEAWHPDDRVTLAERDEPCDGKGLDVNLGPVS